MSEFSEFVNSEYRENYAKAAGGMRRINAGRYENEDGYWSIVKTGHSRWSLIEGYGPGLRSQTEIDVFQRFSDALAVWKLESIER